MGTVIGRGDLGADVEDGVKDVAEAVFAQSKLYPYNNEILSAFTYLFSVVYHFEFLHTFFFTYAFYVFVTYIIEIVKSARYEFKAEVNVEHPLQHTCPPARSTADLEVLGQLQEEPLVRPQLLKRAAVDLSGTQLAQVRLYVVVLREPGHRVRKNKTINGHGSGRTFQV